MKLGRRPTLYLIFGVALVLFTACTPAAEFREVVLTFDGETCQYSGPTVIAEGDLTVVLNNRTDLEASLWIVKLDEGRTWQARLYWRSWVQCASSGVVIWKHSDGNVA
jgi:hypothetical protein